MSPFLGQQEHGSGRRTWGQRMVLTFNVALIAITLMFAVVLGYASDRASSINRVRLDRSLTELQAGERGERVINVLLVGSDSSANLDPDDPIQIGRQGERLGDVIIVAHLDERSGNVALLSLPRDLWVPLAGTDRSDRINRAFLVGGPAVLIDTIEEAFGIPIHHYVNVDFAGFQGLVEAVGTVDVYFESPARDWNTSAVPRPRSQTGFLVEEAGCQSLGPEQALAYVRSRYYQTQQPDGEWVTDPTSDLGRIRRQQDFLQRLLQKAIDLGARNPLVLADLIDTGVQNVAIDQELTPALLIDLSTTYRSFEPGELQTYTFPVSDGTVGSNRVLIPQLIEAAPILRLFEGKPFDNPVTVGVEVVYDPSLASSAAEPPRLPGVVSTIVDQLETSGFDVAAPRQTTVEPGLQIRHSPDGAQAAALVHRALDAALATEPDDPSGSRPRFSWQETTGVSGRNVVIAVGPPETADEPISDLAAPGWPAAPTGRSGGGADPLGPIRTSPDLEEPREAAGQRLTPAPHGCG